MVYTSYSDFPATIQSKLERWGISTTPATRDAEILKAATKAKGVIDSSLVQRFSGSLPFTAATLPQLIKGLSLDLTIYYLSSAQQEVGGTYKDAYTKALELLKQLQGGALPLYSETDETALSPYDTTYGIENNTSEDYDEDDDDYTVFPRSLLGEPPSTFTRIHRPTTEDNLT